jgi:hypothetical protein
MKPYPRTRSNPGTSPARICFILCLFIVVVLMVGFAGTVVTAGTWWTGVIRSDLKLVEATLFGKPVHRVRQPEPKVVSPGDRDDYVELLAKSGIARLPPGR